MHEKTKGNREALPMFFKHPLGTLKYTPLWQHKGKEKLKKGYAEFNWHNKNINSNFTYQKLEYIMTVA